MHLEIAFSALLGASQFTRAGQQACGGVGGYINLICLFSLLKLREWLKSTSGIAKLNFYAKVTQEVFFLSSTLIYILIFV